MGKGKGRKYDRGEVKMKIPVYLKNNVNKAAAKIIPCNNTANNIILCGLLLGSVTPNMNLIFSKTILVETLPYPNKNLVVSLNISNVVSNNPMRPNMVAEPFVEKKLAITKVDDIKLTIDTVKNNFLIKKLGLTDGSELDKGIDAVMEKYGRSNKNKYRVVVYYLLVIHFKKESVYN